MKNLFAVAILLISSVAFASELTTSAPMTEAEMVKAKSDDNHGEDQSRIERLESALGALTQRVNALEDSRNPSGRWSCQAYCGGFDGNSLLQRSISGSGASVADAFEQMVRNCGDHLFVGIDYQGNYRYLRLANIDNACRRD